MAQVYSTVLAGEPLGPRVKLRSEGWQETGGKSPDMFSTGKPINFAVTSLFFFVSLPIVLTHILPGMVRRACPSD